MKDSSRFPFYCIKQLTSSKVKNLNPYPLFQFIKELIKTYKQLEMLTYNIKQVIFK